MPRRAKRPADKTPGAVLLRARERQELSRADLARRTGISEQTIYRTEMSIAKSTRSETFEALAGALGLRMSDLFIDTSAVVHLDDDPANDEVLQAFLQTEIGKTCKPEEVKLLAEIPRRIGKPRDANSYLGMLTMIRSGFSTEALEAAERRRQELEARARIEGRKIVD